MLPGLGTIESTGGSTGGADPGGWSGTKDCDAGINFLKGTPTHNNKYADLPVYPADRGQLRSQSVDVLSDGTEVPEFTNGDPDITDLWLAGVLNDDTRASTYTFDVIWNWRRTKTLPKSRQRTVPELQGQDH